MSLASSRRNSLSLVAAVRRSYKTIERLIQKRGFHIDERRVEDFELDKPENDLFLEQQFFEFSEVPIYFCSQRSPKQLSSWFKDLLLPIERLSEMVVEHPGTNKSPFPFLFVFYSLHNIKTKMEEIELMLKYVNVYVAKTIVKKYPEVLFLFCKELSEKLQKNKTSNNCSLETEDNERLQQCEKIKEYIISIQNSRVPTESAGEETNTDEVSNIYSELDKLLCEEFSNWTPYMFTQFLKETLNVDVTMILVCPGSPAKQPVSTYVLPEYIFFQMFDIRSFFFCILDHVLVPSHEIVERKQLEIFLEQNKIKALDNELPSILFSDKVAQFIGLRPKQICKITRSSKTVGNTIVFKKCVV